MGSIISRFRHTPILNVPADATLEEVNKEYRKSVYQNRDNPEKIKELNCALEENKKTLKFKLYTKDYLEKNFAKRADDFFKRLVCKYEIPGAPLFTDSNYVMFYKYWKNFRHCDYIVNTDIHDVIDLIKGMDGRNAKVKLEPKVKEAPASIKNERRTGDRRICRSGAKFYCDACNKMYMNEQGLINHRRSRKHIMKVGIHNVNNDDLKPSNSNKTVDGNEVESIVTDDKIVESIVTDDKIVESIVTDDKIVDSGKNVLEDEERTGKHCRNEHELFRTCSLCGEIFEDRKSVIFHIREKHQGKEDEAP